MEHPVPSTTSWTNYYSSWTRPSTKVAYCRGINNQRPNEALNGEDHASGYALPLLESLDCTIIEGRIPYLANWRMAQRKPAEYPSVLIISAPPLQLLQAGESDLHVAISKLCVSCSNRAIGLRHVSLTKHRFITFRLCEHGVGDLLHSCLVLFPHLHCLIPTPK